MRHLEIIKQKDPKFPKVEHFDETRAKELIARSSFRNSNDPKEPPMVDLSNFDIKKIPQELNDIQMSKLVLGNNPNLTTLSFDWQSQKELTKVEIFQGTALNFENENNQLRTIAFVAQRNYDRLEPELALRNRLRALNKPIPDQKKFFKQFELEM